MYQRAAQRQLLLHPARQFARLPVLERLNLFVNVRDQVVIFLDSGIEHRGEEPQILLHRQILIERELSRHISNDIAYLPVVLHHVVSHHSRVSLVGEHQGGENTEKRRLPGSVRPDNAIQLALAHGKAHAIQRARLAVGFV